MRTEYMTYIVLLSVREMRQERDRHIRKHTAQGITHTHVAVEYDML